MTPSSPLAQNYKWTSGLIVVVVVIVIGIVMVIILIVIIVIKTLLIMSGTRTLSPQSLKPQPETINFNTQPWTRQDEATWSKYQKCQSPSASQARLNPRAVRP